MDVETQQHAEIRETVRRFAQDQLLPNALRWDREREFPRQALQELGAMGLFGVTIPEKWGGAELDNTALAIAIEEIAAGDCSTSLIVAVNNIISKILDGFGSQSQKELFLKELASGKINGAFALTEPQVGSDASSISTRAERQGSHYELNGAKQFITTGKNADIAVVFAVTNKDAGKRAHCPGESRVRAHQRCRAGNRYRPFGAGCSSLTCVRTKNHGQAHHRTSGREFSAG